MHSKPAACFCSPPAPPSPVTDRPTEDNTNKPICWSLWCNAKQTLHHPAYSSFYGRFPIWSSQTLNERSFFFFFWKFFSTRKHSIVWGGSHLASCPFRVVSTSFNGESMQALWRKRAGTRWVTRVSFGDNDKIFVLMTVHRSGQIPRMSLKLWVARVKSKKICSDLQHEIKGSPTSSLSWTGERV